MVSSQLIYIIKNMTADMKNNNYKNNILTILVFLL